MIARDLVELTKPRIVAAGAIAALAGYLAGADAPWADAAASAAPRLDVARLLAALIGITAITAAAGALNQVLERKIDARMPRTANRPLPAGRIGVGAATAYGIALAAGSLALLVTRVNALTAALAFFAFASYLFVYTPLKRVTSLNTFVGAVPGALPPVLGWTAATGRLDVGAYALFAILFLWQLPHFLAIAWLYRDDYARGGLVMLPAHDPDGALTARQACIHAVALCLVSLLPFALRMGGPLYLVGALLLGALFLVPAFRFLRTPAEASARTLLRASLVYLPGLLCLIALGR
jgi:protoheme IX farnesyltransferase